jgi:hypothetical protein
MISLLIRTFLLLSLSTAAFAQPPGGMPEGMPAGPPPAGAEDPFPGFLEKFATLDAETTPPEDAVLVVGSSIFEAWTDVADHMAPLPAFNRSIGGSKTANILEHADALILYKPAVVVMYTGINDLSEGVSREDVESNLAQLFAVINDKLPETHIVYAGAIKSHVAPQNWELIDGTNATIQALAAKNPSLDYVDLRPVIYDESGEIRPGMVQPDGLHLEAAAYAEFAKQVKPFIDAAMK